MFTGETTFVRLVIVALPGLFSYLFFFFFFFFFFSFSTYQAPFDNAL